MWLTDLDASCPHTICADKPMRVRRLVQAITRVYCVFRDKPGGLVVDYLTFAGQLGGTVSKSKSHTGRSNR